MSQGNEGAVRLILLTLLLKGPGFLICPQSSLWLDGECNKLRKAQD